MPRRADLGEHRNDHQVATAEAFERRGYVVAVTDREALWTALNTRAGLSVPPAIAPAAEPGLIEAVKEFICAASR